VLLADALARLPAEYREVIILHNLEQLPIDDIAGAGAPPAMRPACCGRGRWKAELPV
jgi:hypothetical protein